MGTFGIIPEIMFLYCMLCCCSCCTTLYSTVGLFFIVQWVFGVPVYTENNTLVWTNFIEEAKKRDCKNQQSKTGWLVNVEKKIFGAKSCTVFFGCPYKTKIKHMSINTPSLLISLVYAVLFCMKILFKDSTHPSLANAQGKSSLDFILNSNFTVILKFILSSGSRLHFELFK